MNALIYKVIFCRTRLQFIVVGETAKSGAKKQARMLSSACTRWVEQLSVVSNWILQGSSSLLVASTLLLSAQQVSAEDVRADASAPVTQQPTVLQAANGVPQVNIQAPNSAGVSRNTYSAFDIDSRGVILNNSRSSVNTQLGGFVAANPQMAAGEASVILNEINSSKRSDINGFIEVAGKRADVIVANPSGISCKGCGFINAQQGTLTTGQVRFNGAQIEGYKVEQGSIELDGFNANDADYASIISRAVEVNGNVQAQELRVTTGLNTVDAANLNVQRNAATAADAPQFSLDVKALGGMYAGKITLVGTEDGVGVRNAGSIGASSSELVIRDGQLVNSGSINASDKALLEITESVDNSGLINAQDIELKTQSLSNTGRIYATELSVAAKQIVNGVEVTDKLLYNAANHATGVIASRGSLNIGAEEISSFSGSLIYSEGDLRIGRELDGNRLAFNSAQTLKNYSAEISTNANLFIDVDTLDNKDVHYDIVAVDTGQQYNATDYRPHNTSNRYDSSVIVWGRTSKGATKISAPVNVEDYYIYSVNRKVSRDELQNTKAGQLLAAGDITLNTQTLTNDQSQIAAGGDLTLNAATVVNTDVVINEHYDETGTVRYSHVESCNRGKDHCRRTGGASPYSEVREIATADFFTGSAKSNTNVDNSSASVDGLSAAANAVFNSQFFQKNIDDATKPLIETDPQFTNYRTWLSSDYALQNLPLAPGVSQQRLGDGYVEQRLIQQQVMAQTGRRFIGSYTSDEEQYRALMNNGVDIAQQYNWMPGLALDETQIAALTQDIVWLEQRDITLADGRVVQVLAPQLYRAVSEGDISGSGALLSGRSVSIDATGTLSNAGVINAAEQLIVSADQIESTGGGFGASDVALNSQGDIALTSSVVAAKSAVSLKAQGDITLATDVVEKSTNVAGNTVITRSLQQTAGIQLSDAGAQLTLESAGDIELRGARIENRGENSTTAITAAGDVSLTTVESGRDSQIRWDADNSLDDSDSREHGSSLVVDDLTISAQGDIALRAVSVEAEGELKLAADGSVSIEEGRAKQRTEQHRKITKSSAFGKKTTIAHFENETDQALLSNLQAEQLSIEAAESIDIQGANLVSQQDLTLKAEEGVNVASAQNHQRTYDYSVTKKSGLMSGGSFGVSLGKRSQLDQVETRSTTQVSSTLGSLSGDVNLTAGETLSVKGSELLAREQDINLQAADVELEPADDTRSLSERHEFKQSGLTLALTGGAISAVQSIDASVKTAKQTDNKKLQALHAWKVKNALEGLPGQLEGASELIQNPSEESLESSGMSLSLSLGSSSSTQTREQQSTTALGTSVQAEGDIKITATGVAGDSSSGDIDARGALIEGRNVTLNAANDINLQSAENTERDDSTSSSSSAGIGVSIGSGGLQFTVNASRSRGLENQSSDRYLESQIKARETASLTSGNDTSLTGAQIDAERIELDVGGDLNITSQQDQEAYRKRQESFGLSAGFGVGGSPITASINGSKLKADSNYRAVQQQSGLFAGEGGYQVQVGGNTALVGGAIVSDADASQNSLDTETLSLAKVENSAEYSIDAKSFGFSTNPAEGGGIDKAVSGGLASDEGSSANTTYAAISEGEVTVRANPEIDLAAQTALKRSQAEAHQVLARIFDKSQVQAVEDELAVQQILSQEVPKAIGDYAQKQMDKIDDLLDLAEKADAEQNSARANQLRAEISQIEANWGEQGEYRVLLHTLSGALSGNLQGAVGALATAVAVPELASTFDEMGLSDTQKGALLLLASGAIGAVANGDIGAVNSVGQAANNYLDHEEDQRRIQFKRERYELERKLASEECDDANSCQEYATRLAEVTAEIVELSKLDNKRDIDLSSACKDSPTSQKCLRELAKLEVAARSYADNKAKPEADSDMLSTLAQFGTEQRNLTTLVAAGAIAKIGVDTVEGTIELAKLAGLASIGNEQAQQELYAIAVQLKDFVSDPVGNIDSHTKQQLELAAQHRANGDEVAAQQVELELAYNYIFSATGLAGTAAQIPKGVIRAAGRSETSNSSSSEPNEGVETTGEHGQNDDAQGEVVTAETDTNLPPDNGRLELPSGWKKVDGKTYDAEGFEVALKEGENGYWVRVNSGTEGNAGGNTTSTSTGGVPGGSAASSQLNVTDYTLPNGKVTQVASDGNAIVQLDKIEKFAQGNLPNVTTERRLLDQFKQKNRKEFDADPANAERLDLLKRQESNFKRSNAMRQNLERVGLTDTPANNQIIMEHLLDVGNKINSDNRVWFPSVLKGPNGKIQVESTWKLIEGQKAYLATLKFKPIN